MATLFSILKKINHVGSKIEDEILTMIFSSNVCSTSSNNNNSICSGNTSNTECGTSLPGIPGNSWIIEKRYSRE